MKTCPNCGELVGDSAENCFNCKYSFVSKRVVSNDELKRQKEERIKQSIAELSSRQRCMAWDWKQT